MKKPFLIDICVHMYTAHANASVKKMKKSVILNSEFRDLILATHEYLRNLGTDFALSGKEFRKKDIFKGINETGTIEKTNIPINVRFRVSSKLGKKREIDWYRDHMVSLNNDLIWYPSYIQINNVITRGITSNSFWMADVFIGELIKQIGNSTIDDFKNGMIIHNRPFTFHKAQFKSKRVGICYY